MSKVCCKEDEVLRLGLSSITLKNHNKMCQAMEK